MILGLLFIIFVIGFFVAIFNDWSEWVLLFFLFGIFVCLIIGGFQERAKSMETITTKQPPQIDTTITYSNGVADTVYTYRIIKKK